MVMNVGTWKQLLVLGIYIKSSTCTTNNTYSLYVFDYYRVPCCDRKISFIYHQIANQSNFIRSHCTFLY